MRHDLFDAVQRVVVANPVDQRAQRQVGGVDIATVRGDRLIQTRGRRLPIVVEGQRAAEEFVVDGDRAAGELARGAKRAPTTAPCSDSVVVKTRSTTP
jgi:hypothetical protein